MLILDEIDVRGFKIIEYRSFAGNVWEIILKDHKRSLEEGPKIVGLAIPSRPQTTEHSMVRRPIGASSKSVFDG